MEVINYHTRANDPTQSEYGLRCKVKAVRTYGKQGELGGNTEFTAIVFEPIDSDSTRLFFGAWLPDEVTKHTEVVIEFGYPIYGHARAAVLRKGKFFDRPHLLLMSVGLEEILKNYDSNFIEFKTLPASQDEKADKARDDINSVVGKFKWT